MSQLLLLPEMHGCHVSVSKNRYETFSVFTNLGIQIFLSKIVLCQTFLFHAFMVGWGFKNSKEFSPIFTTFGVQISKNLEIQILYNLCECPNKIEFSRAQTGSKFQNSFFFII
jgi:hypothetical protein